MNPIEQNVRAVQQAIADAANQAKRDPNEITLVAVSKTFPVDAIRAAYAAGIRHFGENRVEEALEKIPAVNAQARDITWHLVGHLQSRKVKHAAPLFDLIHSIDSVSLARKLDTQALALEKKIPILIEVNIAGEPTKSGFAPDPREQFCDAVQQILAFTHLEVQGLMMIPPIVDDAEKARPYFRALRELRDELRDRFPERTWHHLSMGMTDDFPAAIAEGATMVRIGRAIFGERK